MRHSKLKLAVISTVLIMVLVVQSVVAQEDCPDFVDELLPVIDELCSETARNEICYGNNELVAEFFADAEGIEFGAPSDIVGATQVQTLSGSPLDVEEETYGVALMRLQANLPDTQPGQNVTMLLIGDVQVINGVAPDEVPPPVEPVEVTANTNANLRSGPGTGFNVVGTTTNGQTLQAVGRNEAGDWFLVELEDGTSAWIFADLIATEGDLASLPVVSEETQVFSPMSTFYFNTGVGEPACAGAPPDHILVNVPEGLEANFTANGVEFTVGSTGAMRLTDDDTMTVTTFGGTVRIAVGDQQVNIPPGYEADIPVEEVDDVMVAEGGAESLRPYDPAQWELYDGFDQAFIEEFELPEEPEALGEGALQITLSWDNLADMDLSVQTPEGDYIFFGDRTGGGGELDVDSNYPCGSNIFRVENIFWDEGDAPEGEYTISVNQYDTCGDGNANWTLTVRAGDFIILSESGTAGNFTEFQFEFPPDGG